MLTSLLNTLRKSRVAQRAKLRPWVIPTVEPLEDRLALAALFKWIGGGGNALWSNGPNWSVEGVQSTVPPGANDDLLFDGTGYDGAVRPSTVDAAFGGTVRSLKIENSYTEAITLDRNLTVLTSTEIDGGTLAGSKNLYIGPTQPPLALPTFAWTRGTISGSGGTVQNPVGVVIDGSATATISGDAVKTLTGRVVQVNAGATLTWTGGGKIIADDSGTSPGGILSMGTTNIQTTAGIEGTGRLEVGTGGVLNTSVIGEVPVKTRFRNDSSVNINQGKVKLYKNSWNSGTITVVDTSQVTFAGGTGIVHSFDSTQGAMQSTITGPGKAIFEAGSTIDLKGTVNVADVDDASDVLQGTGNLQINGWYLWTGKKWTGTGTVQVGTQTVPSPFLSIDSGGAGSRLERKLIHWG